MKNIFKLLSLALVGSTLFVGCQKEEVGGISFSFEDMNNPKSYIFGLDNNHLYNCWETGEKIYINGGTAKPVTVTNSNSTVSYVSNYTVDDNTPLYCFYGGYNHTGVSNALDNYNPTSHKYVFNVRENMDYVTTTINNRPVQRIDAPTIGYALYNANGRTRICMKNIGSMLQFNIKKGNGSNTILLKSIAVYSNNVLAGKMEVSVNETTTSTYSDYNSTSTQLKYRKLNLTTPQTLTAAPQTYYLPIRSLSNAKIQIVLEVDFNNTPFWISSPVLTDKSIARNTIMQLGTIAIQGEHGDGSSANGPTVFINDNEQTGQAKWSHSKNNPNINLN